MPRFVNDSIVRLLAGAAYATRPLFLKIPYFGPAAMEQLAQLRFVARRRHSRRLGRHDVRRVSNAVGSEEVRRTRCAFGRKINKAEHQLSFVEQLRALADGDTVPAEAVKAYHGALKKLGITPVRTLAADSLPQTAA